MKTVIEVADHFDMSSSSVAHLANSILVTEGKIDASNNNEVLYRQKVDRIKKKVRMEKVEESKGVVVHGLMFDERIDLTKVDKGVGENN